MHSARHPGYVTQFWGNRSKVKVTRAHNVYSYNMP